MVFLRFRRQLKLLADAAGALLVELGADAHAGDKISHDTPLIRAVRIGDVDAANYILVKTKADPNVETEVSGEIALLVACRNVDVPMVELLLNSGCRCEPKKLRDSSFTSGSAVHFELFDGES